MNSKLLLQLIKDDISRMVELTSDFSAEQLPMPEEVEIALSRSLALSKELEMLLRKVSSHPSPKKEKTDIVSSSAEPKEVVTTQAIEETRVQASQEIAPPPAPPVQAVIEEQEEEVTQEAEVMIKTNTPLEAEVEEEAEIEITTPQVAQVVAEVELKTDSNTGANNNSAATTQAVRAEKPEETMPEEVMDEAPKESKTLGESIGSTQPSLNDMLAVNKKESSFSEMPLKSIKDGIGINDRFLFIRELFDNDSNQYEKALSALDSFSTINEAVCFLKENYRWNKNSASSKFLSLIKRRYLN